MAALFFAKAMTTLSTTFSSENLILYMYPFHFSDVLNDLHVAKRQNSRLKVMASLGGEAMKASTFSTFITDIESLNNLTSSINRLYREGLLDGVELDWEWPTREGGKKDRIKLIRYARVSIDMGLTKNVGLIADDIEVSE